MQAIIDTETGGLTKAAGIVEIAIIVIDNDLNELKRWSCIVSRYFIEGTETLCDYSEAAEEIHGITEEMQLIEGIPPHEAVIQLEAIIQDFNVTTFIGHSIRKFDIPRLTAFFNQWSKYENVDLFPEQIDIDLIARENFNFDSYSLANLCKEFGIEHDDAHRALPDCVATLEVTRAIDNEI
jgi:DNA polymerase III epsilon subunit-like protein